MGMAAILVLSPGPFEKTFIPQSKRGSAWNFASIGPVVLEEIFENVDTHTYYYTHTHYRRHMPADRAFGSAELKMKWYLKIWNSLWLKTSSVVKGFLN